MNRVLECFDPQLVRVIFDNITLQWIAEHTGVLSRTNDMQIAIPFHVLCECQYHFPKYLKFHSATGDNIIEFYNWNTILYQL